MGGTWSAIVRGAQRRERDRRRCGPTREDHNWTAAVHRRGLLAFLVSYSPLARARPRSGETKVPETGTCDRSWARVLVGLSLSSSSWHHWASSIRGEAGDK